MFLFFLLKNLGCLWAGYMQLCSYIAFKMKNNFIFYIQVKQM